MHQPTDPRGNRLAAAPVVAIAAALIGAEALSRLTTDVARGLPCRSTPHPWGEDPMNREDPPPAGPAAPRDRQPVPLYVTASDACEAHTRRRPALDARNSPTVTVHELHFLADRRDRRDCSCAQFPGTSLTASASRRIRRIGPCHRHQRRQYSGGKPAPGVRGIAGGSGDLVPALHRAAERRGEACRIGLAHCRERLRLDLLRQPAHTRGDDPAAARQRGRARCRSGLPPHRAAPRCPPSSGWW